MVFGLFQAPKASAGNGLTPVPEPLLKGGGPTKELLLECDDFTGSVEVLESHMLSHVRELVAEDFDEDMLPAAFYFSCNNIRLSTKQEARKSAWDLVEQVHTVRIHDKSKKRVLPPSTTTAVDASEEDTTKDVTGSNKKARLSDAKENDENGSPLVSMATNTVGEKRAPLALLEERRPKEPRALTLMVQDEPIVEDSSKSTVDPSTGSSTTTEEKDAVDAESVTKDDDASFLTSLENLSQDTAVATVDEDATATLSTEPKPAAADSTTTSGSNLDEDAGAAPETECETAALLQAPASQEDEEEDEEATDENEEEEEEDRSECIRRQYLFMGEESEEEVYEEDDEEDDAIETVGDLETAPVDASPDKTGDDDSMGNVDDEVAVASEIENVASVPDETIQSAEDMQVDSETNKPAATPPAAKEAIETIKTHATATAKCATAVAVDKTEIVVMKEDEPTCKDKAMVEEEEPVGEEKAVIETKENPHEVHDDALKKSCQVLNDLSAVLQNNPLFCTEDRRQEWTEEIQAQLAKSAPKTIIGVLGSTGVGKSSLLNALLDEAAVLPTSGSRGCTAAVVELRFNSDLETPPEGATMLPVYKGKIEFMKLEEWAHELKMLVGECSTHEEKTIYARIPEDQNQPDAAAAWGKINQVYGTGTMERYHGRSGAHVFQTLVRDRRVTTLLTPTNGEPYSSILVSEGEIEVDKAKMLLGGFSKMKTRTRRTVKKWAKTFRGKINDFVYRKGNGGGPQTWPLIRCVTVHGPWSVLSTDACLVDLPGVRDANAARARVAERYLQNCSQIWVVAPIKRAVDDGTAKELMGEQFKRRLLMDGAYGNVSFICTQTDDCEATEIMRDHQDVAMLKPGRWERMQELLEKITSNEKEISDFQQSEEDLNVTYEEALETEKEAREELEDAEKSKEKVTDDDTIEFDDDEDIDNEDVEELIEQLKVTAGENKETVAEARVELRQYREAHKEVIEQLGEQTRKLQRKLKSMCATVRNEYSTACLQEDFRTGLKELYRDADDSGDTNAAGKQALPEGVDMPVYCISANDYLKVAGIKPSSDGGPNTFSNTTDTNIPNLREFVHDTTAKYRVHFSEAFANSTSDLVDRIKLLAADATDGGGGTRSARKCKHVFEQEMKTLEGKVGTVARDFRRKVEGKVRTTLQPSLEAGAANGHTSALSTVASWGSKSRRSRNERNPQKNGIYYSTYQAVTRREGVYTSASAGDINFNQELCDPMEKNFSPAWREIMDTSIRAILGECERQVLALCAAVDRTVITGFVQTGLDQARLASMANTANRSCTTALKASFQVMRGMATDSQRELNRSLLPKIQERMKDGYTACNTVAGGQGKFSRMKYAVESHSHSAVFSMFGESTKELLAAIRNLIVELSTMISATALRATRTLESVYSICWDDQTSKKALVDPVHMQKVRECRNQCLPDLNRLRKAQDDVFQLLGIEQEELELDLVGVDSLEKRQEQKLQEAIQQGDLIDLCDSDDEDLGSRKPAAIKSNPNSALAIQLRKVKTERHSMI